MRKISVNLTEDVERALDRIVKLNDDCTISDVINTAVLALGMDKHPCIIRNDTYMDELRVKVKNSPFRSIDNWCEQRSINKGRLKYLMRRIAQGKSYIGDGPSRHKYRLREDDRVYKTHTAWIAHCLLTDFEIDLCKNND